MREKLNQRTSTKGEEKKGSTPLTLPYQEQNIIYPGKT
ncbi:hypothetical protein Sarmat_01109 [Rickettsiales endosymbiont of Paramecium tredecaurelia]|nr:hypothetical protein [Candidatus Sarmatiella mevalonica]